MNPTYIISCLVVLIIIFMYYYYNTETSLETIEAKLKDNEIKLAAANSALNNCLTASILSPEDIAANAQKIVELQAAITSLQVKLTETESALSKCKSGSSDATSSLADLAALRADKAALLTQLVDCKAKMAPLDSYNNCLKDVQALQAERDQLKAQVAQIMSQLDKCSAANKTIIDDYASKFSAANSQLTAANTQLSAANTQLTAANSQLGAVTSSLDTCNASVSGFICPKYTDSMKTYTANTTVTVQNSCLAPSAEMPSNLTDIPAKNPPAIMVDRSDNSVRKLLQYLMNFGEFTIVNRKVDLYIDGAINQDAIYGSLVFKLNRWVLNTPFPEVLITYKIEGNPVFTDVFTFSGLDPENYAILTRATRPTYMVKIGQIGENILNIMQTDSSPIIANNQSMGINKKLYGDELANWTAQTKSYNDAQAELANLKSPIAPTIDRAIYSYPTLPSNVSAINTCLAPMKMAQTEYVNALANALGRGYLTATGNYNAAITTGLACVLATPIVAPEPTLTQLKTMVSGYIIELKAYQKILYNNQMLLSNYFNTLDLYNARVATLMTITNPGVFTLNTAKSAFILSSLTV